MTSDPDAAAEAGKDAPIWVATQAPRDLFKLYGFIDTSFEKVAQTPAGVNANGNTTYQTNPHDFDVLNFNIMAQGALSQRFRYFFNLAAPGSGSPAEDSPISLRNAWVEANIAGPFLAVRMGKTYRRFGLYNEILDATPTFIGIEPPELFDKDHLMLTRTTNFMLHGRATAGPLTFKYAAMTGNDERAPGAVPLGLDANINVAGVFTVGSSFYTTGGDAQSSHGVGEGPPIGGVATWMSRDRYMVYGGYLELNAEGFLLQAEYWSSPHSGQRDLDQVALLAGGDLNAAQLANFGLDTGNLKRKASYSVETFYLRSGYSLNTDLGVFKKPWEITPYIAFDYYSNPETIANKDLGGDNEAGISDDGLFYKATAGVRVRPVPSVAVKVDGSSHLQTYNGALEYYPEIRLSFSYYWTMPGLER
ncbi:MAG: hypothetical protein H6741_18735 [Alphaproteobacteria bacterium]|nr:hypothetical protein [Alphaproteobacteria bacterium]MCB9794747.1 hypothetical protein [Alphaproteobacteria bacterium]